MRSYDYVIVGAGSAGCVVTRRLLDATSATVLLLEAGGSAEGVNSISNPPQWGENIGSQNDWAYRYEPSPHVLHRSIPLSLGKVVGGSGSINGMIWARGHRADYDSWAAAGNPGWDFDSVLPLFKKSEDWEDGANDFRGSGGPIHVERCQKSPPGGSRVHRREQILGNALPRRHECPRARRRRPDEPEHSGQGPLRSRRGVLASGDRAPEPDGPYRRGSR